ncbi:MAG: hypothetical protein JXR31_03300 [Prolixibacteraceae bacterium]|nr:hypothetical protein [Prolixibacteraceae bacterium]
MKKNVIIILSLFLSIGSFAQLNEKDNINVDSYEPYSRFDIRKKKGFYSIMQVSLLFGNTQSTERIVNYKLDYSSFSSSSIYAPVYSYPYTQTKLTLAPSVAISNGYMFNENWAIGAGVGFEIFDHNLFPFFAELRYTLWDSKISPFITMKSGYSFGNFKANHYDEIYINWEPYSISDASLRNYGGFMFHPELGVKVPLNENSDLLVTAAYRHQKTKSVVRKDYESNQFDEWEHKENLNRLSFGVAIMFR